MGAPTIFLTYSGTQVTGHGSTPDGTIPANAIACTSAQAAAWEGSTVVAGAIVAGSPPAATLAQQAATALGAGLAITSTGTSALDGTYDVSEASQGHFQAEMIALLNSGGATFADGTATVVWPDMASPPANHTFNTTQGKAMFLAAGAYVAALYKCMNGTLSVLPSPTATIS